MVRHGEPSIRFQPQEIVVTGLAMYQLPNSEALSQTDIDRYKQGNQKMFIELADIGVDGSNRFTEPEMTIVCAMIQRFPLEKQAVLVRHGLHSRNPETREAAAKAIDRIPTDEQPVLRQMVIELLEAGLKAATADHKINAAKLIPFVPEPARARFQDWTATIIADALDTETDQHTLEKFTQLIPYATKGRRILLINRSLQHPNWDVRAVATKTITAVEEKDQQQLQEQVIKQIKANLDSGEIENPRALCAMLLSIKSPEQPQLIERLLELSYDLWVILSIIEKIPSLPENYRSQIIVSLFNSGHMLAMPEVVKMICLAPKDERSRLYQMVKEYIEASLSSEYENLILSLFPFAKPEDKPMLRERARAAGIQVLNIDQKTATHTPLYAEVADANFIRKNFTKSGSKTTLLGGVPGMTGINLKEQVILREIKFGNYLLWLQCYEAANAWKEAGLTHVPIEPIVKASLNKQKLEAKVFARVLRGPNVETWLAGDGSYAEEIERQIIIIKKVMRNLGIVHGHIHDKNFVVIFENNSDDGGALGKPKVYLIDFDSMYMADEAL